MPFQPPPSKATMIIKAEPPPEVAHELALLQENALITPEAARALTVASANLTTMKRVSTGVGQRHFNKIDTLLSVRKPTPVSEAREVLAALGQTWESLAGDFHRYRKLHYQAKLLRAKLNKTKNGVLATLEGMDADDRAIAEAQAALDQASIDEIEAEVAKGHGALKIALEQATAASTKYAAICTAAGKDPNAGGFTEDDFLIEETDYYLKSAFWHASQSFREVDMRGKWDRPTAEPTNRRDAHALKYGGLMTNGTHTEGFRKFSRIQVETEVKLYLEGMGIPWPVMQTELNKMLESQEMMEVIHNGKGQDLSAEKETRYHQWLDRMVVKYRDGALGMLKQHGPGRLQRIAKILTPTDSEQGKGDTKAVNRTSVIE